MLQEQIDQIGALQQFNRHKYFQKGLGMRLVLVKDILSIYGGEFIITSEKDVFTLVKVYLKVKGKN
jgi:C4-dicarboxylate-specific signal transduction histidine kinase